MTVPVPASQQASEAAAIVRAALSHASLDDPWGLNPERYRNSISAGKAALAELVSLAARTEEAEAEEARLSEAQMLLNAAEAALAVTERERDYFKGDRDRVVELLDSALRRCAALEASS